MATAFVAILDGKPDPERIKLWAFGLACLAWDVDELWYVDKTLAGLGEWQAHEARLPVRQVASLARVLEEAQGRRLVCVEGPRGALREAKDLRGYEHPADAVYLFGGDRAASLPTLELAAVEADWLTIPARRGVYGFMAATVVAQHRAMQRGARY